jgi:hypothetical protein
MVDMNSNKNNDSVSVLSINSMGNKTQKNCSIFTSNKNHNRMKQSTSNNDYNNSSLTVYHQNIRGINNKINELVNQWGSKISPLIWLTKHHLSNTEISCVNFDSYNLGSYFCRKQKNGGVTIVVHETLQYTSVDLNEFCIELDIEM